MQWVRIKSLGTIMRGSGIKRNETVESGYPCVRYGEIYTTYNTSFASTVSFIPEEINEKCKHFSHGDILMTLTGENKPDIAKAVAYLGTNPVAAGGDLAYWTAHGMNPLYLSYLLASPYVINHKVKLATGDIIVHISGDKIGSILIPIPPLNEQMRIVEKIQETEYQIRQYGEKEQELTILHGTFPEAMKKSILLQAVQGKLVEQDPSDEPAEVLLERIRAEKQRLIKEGKIKKDKHESIIFRRDNSHYEKLDGEEHCIDDELPFDIPNSWIWTRLNSLGYTQTGNTPSTAHPEYRGDCIPFITPGDIIDGSINYENQSLSEIGKRSARVCPANSILQVCIGGSIGKAALTQLEVTFNQQINSLTPVVVSNKYVFAALTSFMFISAMKENAGGTATPILNRSLWDKMFIPLPPLAEQRRIVQRIEELLPLINGL